MGLFDLFFSNSTKLHNAIRAGDLKTANQLINKDYFDKPDKRGCTPLYWASQEGYKEIVKKLIDRGADVNARDKHDSTPLRAAVVKNHLDIVEELIISGAALNSKHLDGSTPLHSAAEIGDVRMIELLLANGAEINARHDFGEPIYAAAEKNQTPVVSLLIKKGANINVHHIQNETLLHALAFQGCPELLETLISMGLDVNSRNSEGRIPLHYAVEEYTYHHNLNVIDILIKSGSIIETKDKKGKTPLIIAENKRLIEVRELLLNDNV